MYAQRAKETLAIKLGREVVLTHEGEQLFLCAANTSGYLGVTLDKRLHECGRRYCYAASGPRSCDTGDAEIPLGYYASAEDAAAEYARYVRARRLHGHSAR